VSTPLSILSRADVPNLTSLAAIVFFLPRNSS
jgi:hypothetical protein